MKVLTLLIFFLWISLCESEEKSNISKIRRTDRVFESQSFCPKFEKFEECGTGCERTCAHPNQPSFKDCENPCIPYKCTCRKGYYRDNRGTGRCVLPKDCVQFGKKWQSK